MPHRPIRRGPACSARPTCLFLLGVLPVFLAIFVNSAQALTIGLNPLNAPGAGFSGGRADSILGANVAGTCTPINAELRGDRWNNLLQNDLGMPMQLVDSSSLAADSGVYAMWRCSAVGENGIGTANNHYKLMKGFFDCSDGDNDNPLPPDFFTRSRNQPLIYLRGLGPWLGKAGQPAGTNSYAVIVYVDGNGTNRIGEYWLQRVPAGSPDPPTALGPDLTTHVFVRDPGTNFIGSYVQVPLSANSEATAGNGNFILWRGLKADSFILRTEARSSGDGIKRAPINGVQIVAEANASWPIITVTATDAAEPVAGGTFTVTRTGSVSGSLTVNYGISGTATPGADYQALAGSVTILSGSASATISVVPIDDILIEGTETITLSLIAGSYVDGTPNGDGVTMHLSDDDVLPVVTVAATDGTAAEVSGDTGVFTIARAASQRMIDQTPLTVYYTLGGTAVNGCDFARINNSITLAAGQATATVSIAPYEDPAIEGTETVVLSISSNSQYTPGGSATATINIVDNGRTWTQSKPLVFGGYIGTEEVTDFPVLVVLTPERVGNYAAFAPGGADLRFQLPDGNCLPYEVEQWDPAGTSLVWVRMPSIAGRTDYLTMRWGNSNAAGMHDPPSVWSNGYVGVWHLDAPNTGGLYADSTGRGFDASSNGAARVPGRIGGALAFEADLGCYVDTHNAEDLANFTISAWVRSREVPGDRAGAGPLDRDRNYQMCWNQSAAEARASVGMTANGWHKTPFGPVGADTWYYVAGTYDGHTLRAYRDGILVGADDGPEGPPQHEPASLKLGRHASESQFFTGVVDEVEVAAVAWPQTRIVNQYACVTDTLVAWSGPRTFDGDRDGDVDQDDFGAIQRCFAGAGRLLIRNECLPFDADGDHCISMQEIEALIGCVSGPDVPATANCIALP